MQAGDFVSYFARAADNDGVAGPKRASSDLYFVQVRPLKKEFRRAESQAGGGGGGGGGAAKSARSRSSSGKSSRQPSTSSAIARR